MSEVEDGESVIWGVGGLKGSRCLVDVGAGSTRVGQREGQSIVRIKARRRSRAREISLCDDPGKCT